MTTIWKYLTDYMSVCVFVGSYSTSGSLNCKWVVPKLPEYESLVACSRSLIGQCPMRYCFIYFIFVSVLSSSPLLRLFLVQCPMRYCVFCFDSSISIIIIIITTRSQCMYFTRSNTTGTSEVRRCTQTYEMP